MNMSYDEVIAMQFTKEKVTRLRAEYDKAVKDGAETFMFDGTELLTSYAKYLLEYLDNMMGVKV